MMLNPLLSLAVSVHGNRGVYALLLGSGLSSSAGIPTGWGIILDLIQRIAALEGEEVERNKAEDWYLTRFGQGPEYGELLDALAKSQTERQQLLRTYFEPTPEEREEGRKAPTDAHRAIAELVSRGAVRVIVTTNFDRLMERALEEAGITPTVIASADAAQGALPLAHSPCTILKLHGDYMDTRIRNTAGELESYSPDLDHVLDQVLDEYGLIVCGWSGEWDTALRAAMQRVKGHRFTTFWATYGEPAPAARDLIQLRRAVVIPIGGADTFFRDLSEKVASLEELSRPDPLSAAVAVQSLKRYLPKSEHRIRLHDLVMGETQRVVEAISDPAFMRDPFSPEEFNRRVRHLEQASGLLMDLFAAGCYHGREEHEALWTESLNRLGQASAGPRSGLKAYGNLLSYPALLAIYAGGIAAVTAGQYGTLRALLVDARRPDYGGKERPLLLSLRTRDIMENGVDEYLPGCKDKLLPIHGHLQELLAPHLVPYTGDERGYAAAFYRYEYLAALIFRDVAEREEEERHFTYSHHPVGLFALSAEYRGTRLGVDLEEEVAEQGAQWPPFQAGLFKGDPEHFSAVKAKADGTLMAVARDLRR